MPAVRVGFKEVMPFKRGDHICAIYSTTEELTREVARFLAQGIRNRERSWYVGSGDEMVSLGEKLRKLGIDVAAETKRKALQLIPGDAEYIVHRRFNPEATLQIFNDAIEQAYTDGFTGFRAAAEMSWALDCTAGPHQVIVYEALLKSLFANCRAIGFYDRTRMPLEVINGALLTHPIAGVLGHYSANQFCDPATTGPTSIEPADVSRKLARLDRSSPLP